MDSNNVIAIGAQSTDADGFVSSRFSRADYFAIYHHDRLDFEFIENAAKHEASGAGANAAKILASHGVTTCLVPEVGPKALEALHAFDIDIYRYTKEYSVRDALYEFYENKLCHITASTVKGSHK